MDSPAPLQAWRGSKVRAVLDRVLILKTRHLGAAFCACSIGEKSSGPALLSVRSALRKAAAWLYPRFGRFLLVLDCGFTDVASLHGAGPPYDASIFGCQIVTHGLGEPSELPTIDGLVAASLTALTWLRADPLNVIMLLAPSPLHLSMLLAAMATCNHTVSPRVGDSLSAAAVAGASPPSTPTEESVLDAVSRLILPAAVSSGALVPLNTAGGAVGGSSSGASSGSGAGSGASGAASPLIAASGGAAVVSATGTAWMAISSGGATAAFNASAASSSASLPTAPYATADTAAAEAARYGVPLCDMSAGPMLRPAQLNPGLHAAAAAGRAMAGEADAAAPSAGPSSSALAGGFFTASVVLSSSSGSATADGRRWGAIGRPIGPGGALPPALPGVRGGALPTTAAAAAGVGNASGVNAAGTAGAGSSTVAANGGGGGTSSGIAITNSGNNSITSSSASDAIRTTSSSGLLAVVAAGTTSNSSSGSGSVTAAAAAAGSSGGVRSTLPSALGGAGITDPLTSIPWASTRAVRQLLLFRELLEARLALVCWTRVEGDVFCGADCAAAAAATLLPPIEASPVVAAAAAQHSYPPTCGIVTTQRHSNSGDGPTPAVFASILSCILADISRTRGAHAAAASLSAAVGGDAYLASAGANVAGGAGGSPPGSSSASSGSAAEHGKRGGGLFSGMLHRISSRKSFEPAAAAAAAATPTQSAASSSSRGSPIPFKAAGGSVAPPLSPSHKSVSSSSGNGVPASPLLRAPVATSARESGPSSSGVFSLEQLASPPIGAPKQLRLEDAALSSSAPPEDALPRPALTTPSPLLLSSLPPSYTAPPMHSLGVQLVVPRAAAAAVAAVTHGHRKTSSSGSGSRVSGSTATSTGNGRADGPGVALAVASAPLALQRWLLRESKSTAAAHAANQLQSLLLPPRLLQPCVSGCGCLTIQTSVLPAHHSCGTRALLKSLFPPPPAASPSSRPSSMRLTAPPSPPSSATSSSSSRPHSMTLASPPLALLSSSLSNTRQAPLSPFTPPSGKSGDTSAATAVLWDLLSDPLLPPSASFIPPWLYANSALARSVACAAPPIEAACVSSVPLVLRSLTLSAAPLMQGGEVLHTEAGACPAVMVMAVERKPATSTAARRGSSGSTSGGGPTAAYAAASTAGGGSGGASGTCSTSTSLRLLYSSMVQGRRRYRAGHGPVIFPLNVVVPQGEALIRVFDMSAQGEATRLFAFHVHTGLMLPPPEGSSVTSASDTSSASSGSRSRSSPRRWATLTSIGRRDLGIASGDARFPPSFHVTIACTPIPARCLTGSGGRVIQPSQLSLVPPPLLAQPQQQQQRDDAAPDAVIAAATVATPDIDPSDITLFCPGCGYPLPLSECMLGALADRLHLKANTRSARHAARIADAMVKGTPIALVSHDYDEAAEVPLPASSSSDSSSSARAAVAARGGVDGQLPPQPPQPQYPSCPRCSSRRLRRGTLAVAPPSADADAALTSNGNNGSAIPNRSAGVSSSVFIPAVAAVLAGLVPESSACAPVIPPLDARVRTADSARAAEVSHPFDVAADSDAGEGIAFQAMVAARKRARAEELSALKRIEGMFPGLSPDLLRNEVSTCVVEAGPTAKRGEHVCDAKRGRRGPPSDVCERDYTVARQSSTTDVLPCIHEPPAFHVCYGLHTRDQYLLKSIV